MQDFRRIGVTMLAVGALAGPSMVGSALARKASDACKASTQSAFRACRQGAQSDKSLALGRCANLADASAVKACGQKASTDAKDVLGECKDQHDARLAVCEKLGRAPYSPVVDPAGYGPVIDNPLFPLVPGTTFIYEGRTEAGLERDEFAVTHNTRTILGVTCVEVHDTVTVDGRLTEDTLDWFAQDAAGNVWYFGENSREVDGRLVLSLEGSWESGVDGAQPGIVMEAHPVVGDFYRQEYLVGEAEDLAEVTSVDESVALSNNSTYPHSLKTTETSPLEPDALEYKYYAPGVGNVLVVDAATGERSELIEVVIGP